MIPIISHLFVTDRFLIKGRAITGDRRLSTYLETVRKPWVMIEDVTLIDLATRDRVVVQRGHLRSKDIVLAHELLDITGDQFRKTQGEVGSDDLDLVCCYFRHPIRYELTGRVRKDSTLADESSGFHVVLNPSLRGFETAGDADLELVTRLPYLIVQRSHIQCLLGL